MKNSNKKESLRNPPEQLTLFAAGSRDHASHSVLPGSKEARQMTVTSGLNISGLLKKSDPAGLFLKTLLDSSIWASTRCFLTWKVRTTPAKRLLYQLVPSTPRIDGTASGESVTWATPNTMDHLPQRSPKALQRQAATTRKGRTRPANLREQVDPRTVAMWPTPTGTERSGINPTTGRGAGLSKTVQMWPTPQARDYKGQNSVTKMKEKLKQGRRAQQGQLPNAVAMRGNIGQLNPTWVEWLMGFPTGWTDLEASEMPSSHK